MKDMLIKMALEMVEMYLLPALKEYALKTPGKIDDLIVNALVGILHDPAFAEIIKGQ